MRLNIVSFLSKVAYDKSETPSNNLMIEDDLNLKMLVEDSEAHGDANAN